MIHSAGEVIHGFFPTQTIVVVVVAKTFHELQSERFTLTIVIQWETAFLRSCCLERSLREGHRRHGDDKSLLARHNSNRDFRAEQLDMDDGIGSSLGGWQTIFVNVIYIVDEVDSCSPDVQID